MFALEQSVIDRMPSFFLIVAFATNKDFYDRFNIYYKELESDPSKSKFKTKELDEFMGAIKKTSTMISNSPIVKNDQLMQVFANMRKQKQNISKLCFTTIEISELEKALESMPFELKTLALRISKDALRIYINSAYDRKVLPKVEFIDNNEDLHAEMSLLEYLMLKLLKEENPQITPEQWKKIETKEIERMKKKLIEKIKESGMKVRDYIRVKYVGVSKLCCQFCHSILAAESVSIEHRGTSNITFIGWFVPCLANALSNSEIKISCKRAYKYAEDLKAKGKKL